MVSSFNANKVISNGKSARLAWLNFSTFAVFSFPFLTIWTVDFFGKLMISDICVALLLPYLFLSRKFSFRQPYLRAILLMLAVWLAGAILSDFVNDSRPEDFARGWAAIIFFAAHLIAFFVLIDGKRERLFAAIIGMALATLLGWLSGSAEYSSSDLTDTPWRMGNGFAVTLLFAAFVRSRLPNDRPVGFVIMLLSPIHLFLNARSLFLTTMLSGFVSAFSIRVRTGQMRGMTLLALIFCTVVAGPIAEGAYDQLTAAGIFGVDAQRKNEDQTNGGTVNILLGGRSESLVSLGAIADAPIFGHGSWAQDREYFYEYVVELRKIGNHNDVTANGFLIPTHSILLGSWVYNGIAGGLFWIFILIIAIRAAVVALFGQVQVSVVENLIIFMMMWDIFFSPFGQARRCTEAIYIIVACQVLVRASRDALRRRGVY